jgi:membrane-associated phospholipid phosphatase
VGLVVLGYAIGGLGYLAVNRVLGEGPFPRLELPIDRAIPFVPAFVFGYILVYFTPALTALFLRDRAELYRTFLAFGLNALICFPIFLFFPVEYPRVHPLPATGAGPLLALVQALDRPVNCFPSHHISTSITTFLAVFRQDRRWGSLFGAAAALVAVSTLFIKQHYVVDIPAGIAVACLTYCLTFPRRGR